MALGLLYSPREVIPSRLLSSWELVKIESEPLYLSHTHSHSVVAHSRGRERHWGKEEIGYCCQEIILLFWGFTFGVDSSLRKLWGFLHLWFPQGKKSVHCLLCLIVVLVILLVKDPNIMLA